MGYKNYDISFLEFLKKADDLCFLLLKGKLVDKNNCLLEGSNYRAEVFSDPKNRIRRASKLHAKTWKTSFVDEFINNGTDYWYQHLPSYYYVTNQDNKTIDEKFAWRWSGIAVEYNWLKKVASDRPIKARITPDELFKTNKFKGAAVFYEKGILLAYIVTLKWKKVGKDLVGYKDDVPVLVKNNNRSLVPQLKVTVYVTNDGAFGSYKNKHVYIREGKTIEISNAIIYTKRRWLKTDYKKLYNDTVLIPMTQNL